MFAGTYLGTREFGDPFTGAGARSAAMGSTGLARGGEAAGFALNPAAAGDLESGEVSLSLGPSLLTEKVVETSTSTKFRNNSDWDIKELSAVLPLAGGRAWLGFSVGPAYDLRYEASFTQFSSTGSPTSETRSKNSGLIWALTPGIGVSLTKRFAIGLSYAYWTGKEESRLSQFNYGSGFIADLQEKADYAGGAPRVGLRWKASENLSFGAVLQPSARLTRDYDFVNATATARNRSAKDKWDMPAQWGLGLSYRVAGDHPTEFAAEVVQTDWGSLKINGKNVNTLAATKPIAEEASANAASVFGVASATPRRYRDVTEVRVGVEHVLSDRWSLRLGFHHLPYFADRSVEATFFTAGAGYLTASGKWGWSLAGEFGKRDYKGDNLFFPSTQRADETFRRILLSGQFKW